MIYSASRRTDLVAFYPDYICQKVARSRKLEGIVFWTKDPRNLVAHFGLRAVLGSFPSIIQLTITGLAGTAWEPGVPDPECYRATLTELAAILPAGAVRWRFDPLIIDDTLYERFTRVHELLVSCGIKLEEVVVSFPDPYQRVLARIERYNQSLPPSSNGHTTSKHPTQSHTESASGNSVSLDPSLQYASRINAAEVGFGKLNTVCSSRLLLKLHAISGLPLALCCEPDYLGLPFTRQAHCVDGALFERLYGIHLGDGGLAHDSSQRVACGCTKSTDIGSYDQLCGHDCLYCYARPERDA